MKNEIIQFHGEDCCLSVVDDGVFSRIMIGEEIFMIVKTKNANTVIEGIKELFNKYNEGL